MAQSTTDLCRLSDIGKGAVAVVSQEQVWCSRECVDGFERLSHTELYRDAVTSIGERTFFAKERFDLEVGEICETGNEDVQVAVVIDIDEGRRNGEERIVRYTCLLTAIGKFSVALVVIKRESTAADHQQIGQPVIVIIAGDRNDR